VNTVELAIRIRNLRKGRKMTLADLAQATGLTESMMSKIENFRVTPSLPAVGLVATALGTTLSDLFQGLDERPQISVVRADRRRTLRRDESPWTYSSLGAERTNRKLDPFLVEIPPGRQRGQPDAHEGEEFMFLLEGRLDFLYGGKTYSLHPGDSVYHDGNVEHNLINPSGRTARILVVFCQPQLMESRDRP
jgi:transcriptional regulator with XRE-family HTH domain